MTAGPRSRGPTLGQGCDATKGSRTGNRAGKAADLVRNHHDAEERGKVPGSEREHTLAARSAIA